MVNINYKFNTYLDLLDLLNSDMTNTLLVMIDEKKYLNIGEHKKIRYTDKKVFKTAFITTISHSLLCLCEGHIQSDFYVTHM